MAVSTPETPGIDMPGSFPKQQVPKEQSYFSPESLLSNNNTLPSQEKSNVDYPSTSDTAVGTLPAPPDTSGAAIERMGGEENSIASSDVISPSPIMTTTNNNHVNRHPSDPLERHTGYIPGTLQDDTSLAKLPEERRLQGLPSHDDETNVPLGKSGGVGALPGLANESAVAMLPDERNQVSVDAASDIVSGASTDASVRTLHGSGYMYTPSPLGQSQNVPQTAGREYALARNEEKVFGPDVNIPLETKDAPLAQNKAEPLDQGAHVVGDASGGTDGTGSPEQQVSENATSPKKSTFIHKVKGEMKILSGKMSHNEGKIEEGRRMLGKN